MAMKNKEINNEFRLTKKDFLEEYEKIKENENFSIGLFIHMPDDSIEIIINFNGHNKVKYIKETYDDNLVHNNSKDIYIVNFMMFTDDDMDSFLDEI